MTFDWNAANRHLKELLDMPTETAVKIALDHPNAEPLVEAVEAILVAMSEAETPSTVMFVTMASVIGYTVGASQHATPGPGSCEAMASMLELIDGVIRYSAEQGSKGSEPCPTQIH